MDYCNLRAFTHYSFFKSIIKTKDLISHCKKNNINHIGICEEMNLGSFVELCQEAQKHNIKPALGVLINIKQLGLVPFFIKNQEGFHLISKILTECNIKQQKSVAMNVFKNQKGLVAFIGGENSYFYSNDMNLSQTKTYIKEFQEYFPPEDLFIEIQPKNNFKKLLQCALDENIPIVCSHPVKFLDPEDHKNLYVLKCLGNKTKYNHDEFINDGDKLNFLHTKESLETMFEITPEDNIDLTEGFENSINVLKKCNFFQNASPPALPSFGDNEDEELKNKAFEGLNKRLEHIDSKHHSTYKERLEYELGILQKKGFSGYFLITSDFVAKAIERKIPVGLGRGSGAGSLTAYALRITNVDPIKFGLIFERFLNPERNSMPDFDIDFCPSRRGEIIDYLKEKYGALNVAQICTFGTLQAKAAFKDVARVFSIPFFKADAISKLIPFDQINPIKLKDAIELIPQLKKHAESNEYKEIFKIALKLEGLNKNTSKHAAGVVITGKPLWRFCPLMLDEDGEKVAQLSWGQLDYIGGVKFDFLGLKTLTVIAGAIKHIQKNYNVSLDMDSIPLDDKKTFQFIQTGNLDGVFQFDGPGIRSMLMQLKPDNIEDLIVMNALFRPGPIKKIPSYIARKNKTEEVTYPHISTKSVLEKTYGIIVYQEQVMDIAKICAGYSSGEADSLRRAMGKKKKDEMERNKIKFLKGAKERNIDDKTALHLFDLINEFSGYGFNKSHSAPYAIIAYYCAYLKCHYPKEFLCSFLNEDINNTEKIIRFIKNAQQMGIKVLKPCIMKSKGNFTICGDDLRYGLTALKNIGENNINNFINNRQIHKYKDIYDFVGRNLEDLNKKNWKSLVGSGALDELFDKREMLMENFDSIKKGEAMIPCDSWDPFQYKREEREIFGFFFNDYISSLRNTLKSIGLQNHKTIKNEGWIFGEFNQVKLKRGKTNNSYAFAEVFVGCDVIYLIAFSNVLNTHEKLLKEGFFGMIQIQNLRGKLIIKDIQTLDDFLLKSHDITIEIKDKSSIKVLESILSQEKKENTNSNVIIIHNNESVSSKFKVKDGFELRKKLHQHNLKVL